MCLLLVFSPVRLHKATEPDIVSLACHELLLLSLPKWRRDMLCRFQTRSLCPQRQSQWTADWEQCEQLHQHSSSNERGSLHRHNRDTSIGLNFKKKFLFCLLFWQFETWIKLLFEWLKVLADLIWCVTQITISKIRIKKDFMITRLKKNLTALTTSLSLIFILMH